MITRDWAEVDFYATLGVPRDASDEETAEAFRALAKQLHPDVAGADTATAERFREVATAYEVLSDPGRRADYDRIRAGAVRPVPTTRTTNVTVPARSSANVRWSPGRGRLVTIAGIAAFIAGVLFSAFIVSLQRREAAALDARVQRVGVVVAGQPGLRLAYFAPASDAAAVVDRPAIVEVPASLSETLGDASTVSVAVTPDEPGVEAPEMAPAEWTRVDATVVRTASGTQIVYGDPRSTEPPLVVADPSSRRSAALDDGQALTVYVDGNDPTDVRIDEDTTARDITFWFIAVKLIVAGPLLVGFARYRVRPSGAASANMA